MLWAAKASLQFHSLIGEYRIETAYVPEVYNLIYEIQGMSLKSSFFPQANPAHTSTTKTRPTPKQRSVFILQNAGLARAYLF
jgi:hypothetical protein